MFALIKHVARVPGGILIIILFNGCSATPQTDRLLAAIPPVLLKPVELDKASFYPQQRYQCGPAALATLLNWHGVSVTSSQLADKLYIPGKKGSLQIEVLSTARRYNRIPYIVMPQLSEVLKEVAAGNPVLVFQNLGLDWYPQWHFAVIVGFDTNKNEIILRSGNTRRLVNNFQLFERTWQRAKNWAMVLLKPGQIPETADELRYLQAVSDFEIQKNWLALQAAYNAGVQQWPRSSGLYMGLGNSYYAGANQQAAIRTFRSLLELKPDYAPAHNNLAQVLFESGFPEQAEKHAQRAISIGGKYVDQYRLTLQVILNMKKND